MIASERRPPVPRRAPAISCRWWATARCTPLTAFAAAELGDWYAASVVGGGANAQGLRVAPAGAAGRCTTGSAHRALERACHRAGLVGADGAEAVSLHGLRHTAASVMLGEGVPITVAAQLGHADPAITGRICAHLSDERDLDLAAAAFECRHEGLRAVGLVEEPRSES